MPNDAMKAAWHDRPTEPGLWIFWDDDSREFESDASILDLSDPQQFTAWCTPLPGKKRVYQFYGPFPLPPKFIPPDTKEEK